jgi:hypothetical protein
MKSSGRKLLGVLFLLLFQGIAVWAQDAEMTVEESKPVKNTFESIFIIDNQTVMVPYKNTFEFDIQHRFGLIENGYEDFWGLFAPSNIRLGFGYVPIDRLMVGFGITKQNITWDLNAKYALLRQMTSGGSPVSLTYYGNASIDTRDESYFPNPEDFRSTDRWSFFHQLLIARKFSDKFSVQLGGSISHFNAVYPTKDAETGEIEDLDNDHFALAISTRYKISNSTSILLNFDQPLTTRPSKDPDTPDAKDPKPNLSLGIEFTTSAHQFQIFMGNYQSINPQLNNAYNQNWGFGSDQFSQWDPEWLIGFNMTRLWSY